MLSASESAFGEDGSCRGSSRCGIALAERSDVTSTCGGVRETYAWVDEGTGLRSSTGLSGASNLSASRAFSRRRARTGCRSSPLARACPGALGPVSPRPSPSTPGSLTEPTLRTFRAGASVVRGGVRDSSWAESHGRDERASPWSPGGSVDTASEVAVASHGFKAPGRAY